MMKRVGLIAATGLVLVAGGCKKTADVKPNYAAAINTYYSAFPACLWKEEVKFPVQADASDTAKTSMYDALVDQGLLTRTSAEKKQLLILSKRVTNYDLSDKGRGAWTADVQQPGSGNFCYGKPTVSTVDSNTPTTDQPGPSTTVNHHFQVSGAPAWATAAETQNAFPGVREALAGPSAAVATLTNTSNGWQVTTGPGRHASGIASSPDGKVVE